MLAKLNTEFTTKWKNAEIVVYVEDDLITTTKIFIDGDCVDCLEISTEKNPDGAPFNKGNYNRIVAKCKEEVDAMFAALMEKVCNR